jgi:ubiquinone/menaquinone biosynthesis C-methylase UbiE
VLEFDEVASRRVERTYTTPDVVEQRRVAVAALGLRPGERVLDIGSGPGLLAADMAEAVGPGGHVDGVDPSGSMLEMARRRATRTVSYAEGDATSLPFEDGTFDAATATQVYEYVPDMPAALAEARRVLRPGGRLLVLDTDWGSVVWHSTQPDRMRRVLQAWDEHLADPYLPRRLGPLLEDAGFELQSRSIVPILNAGYDVDTYSANLIGFIAAFIPGRQGFEREDAEEWADELTGLGRDYFFSLNRYLFVAAKS